MLSFSRSARLSGLLLSASLTVLAAGPAHAQSGYELSDAFRAQAEQVKASPSAAAAQMLADQAKSPLEKYVAGSLMLQAASSANDLRGERKALSFLFDSKAAPTKELPKLHNQAGILSLMLNDPKDAVAQIRYAEQLGYKDQTGQVALADALARSRDGAGAMAALEGAVPLDGRAAPMAESWYDRAISIAVATNQRSKVALWSQRKLTAYASDRNWRSALIAYVAQPGVGLEETLDLYRLAAARNALVTERDWLTYALAANNAGEFTEAKAALDAGLSRGAILRNDANVAKQAALLAPKSKKLLADLPVKAAAAGKSAKGDAALEVADTYLSSAQYEKAVEYYRMALTKGVADKDRATVRLGIAQIRNGDASGGQASLDQVTSGPWADVATFWSVPSPLTASAAAVLPAAQP